MKLQIDKEKYENNMKKFNQIFMGVMLPLGLVFDGYFIYLSIKLISEKILSEPYKIIPSLLIILIVPTTISKIKTLIKTFKRKDDTKWN